MKKCTNTQDIGMGAHINCGDNYYHKIWICDKCYIESLREELKEAYQGYLDTHDHDNYNADLYKRAMDYIK